MPVCSGPLTQCCMGRQVLDVKASVPNYESLKEISLFQLQQLDPAAALGLYISVGGAEWQYRGFVSNRHPSGKQSTGLQGPYCMK